MGVQAESKVTEKYCYLTVMNTTLFTFWGIPTFFTRQYN
jgi:hypothetical protein